MAPCAVGKSNEMRHLAPYFCHLKPLKNRRWNLIPLVKTRRPGFLIIPHTTGGFLIAQCDLLSVRNIHDAYSHGCNGSALFDRIERTGSVAPSPCRRSSSLCGSTRGMVRMVHAPAGRRRPRPLVQSRPVLGQLRIKRGWSSSRSHRRLASPRRQDRRSRERPVDPTERQ